MVIFLNPSKWIPLVISDIFPIHIQAATVACKQLGFLNGEARYSAHYGPGRGPVHITHVSCLGSETHIRECFLSYAEDDSPNSQRCNHSNDVGVQCSGMCFVICST